MWLQVLSSTIGFEYSFVGWGDTSFVKILRPLNFFACTHADTSTVKHGGPASHAKKEDIWVKSIGFTILVQNFLFSWGDYSCFQWWAEEGSSFLVISDVLYGCYRIRFTEFDAV